MLKTLDQFFFFKLFNLAAENESIGRAVIIITNYSSNLFAGIYFLIMAYLLYNLNSKIIPFIIGPASTYIIVRLINYLYIRPRPFVSLEIESLIEHTASASFPSMHSSSAFVIAIAIYNIYPTFGKVMLGLAVITAVSRVMVGVHYPSDIFGGLILAVLVNSIVFKLFN
ncbi:phosphatase PAP2 family protein [Halanaerobium hydrogeniformans]|uniref:Phosphoesterase PA-phosphatase related protein n=1 Tax=Halanaerobium hydrogeniformans TaxID=656519 RepID=E4RL96_HALHG|nr:phosphatase PAP2 family protein [Halanaerobium hydrogeniformans]ADQ15777.1 phosphoesterase PA-phosphatase related protein [Halanaerobium hydrogeniformans]